MRNHCIRAATEHKAELHLECPSVNACRLLQPIYEAGAGMTRRAHLRPDRGKPLLCFTAVSAASDCSCRPLAATIGGCGQWPRALEGRPFAKGRRGGLVSGDGPGSCYSRGRSCSHRKHCAAGGYWQAAPPMEPLGLSQLTRLRASLQPTHLGGVCLPPASCQPAACC